MEIRDVMTEHVDFVSPETQVLEIARKMRENDIGSTPVVENDRMIGMVTDRDIVIRVVAAGQDVLSATARVAMSPKVLYCFDDQTVEEVLENMGHNQVRRLPVVNRDKRLVGVVSLGDLVKASEGKAGAALHDISQSTHH
jgi:CBS domain-containing protein